MSLRWNGRVLRVVLAVLSAAAVVLASALPAAAEGKKTRRYTVNRGPCQVDEFPKGASQQWTPAGEAIVHRVSYGQGLQDIAWSYGFAGDNAFKRLWDANPQLARPYLERPGITIRIPSCGTELRRRKLPKPPPPPEPEPETESESEAAPSADESTPSTPQPEPDPPAPKPKPAAAVPSGSVWDKLAQCESGGDWSINTGNGYYGGLQFSASSWAAVGGSGLPHQHSREEQIKRGELLQARQGWGAWPACSAKLGLR